MAKLNKTEIANIIEIMAGLYPEAECALEHRDKFQLLVAVVLSAQTTDKSVNQVTPQLFERFPTPYALAEADLDELETLLRRIGMYRTKSKNIKALSKMLIDNYCGEVPRDYDELIKLPGVGRKTANVVLSVGFGIPRIAVDTHVFRLANRIGLTAEKDVLKTELALMKAIPKKRWIMMHHALIWHGRGVCMARNPNCEQCGIHNVCLRNGVEKRIDSENTVKSIKVRELIIGEGPPKICVPLVGRSRKELLSSVSIATRLRPDIYELRADYLKDNPKEMAMIIKDVRTIITNSPLIYTLRSEEEGGQSDLPREHYLNQNLKAIESGHADIIDVELEKGEEVINKLASAAHEKNRHILLSKHYFGKMPHKIEMLKVFQIMQDYPSDIVKIAVMVDNERKLLDLLDISLTMKNECKDRPFVIIGMGKNGMLSRITGGIFGSALTFSKGSEPSAPGQLGVEEVRQVIELLDKNI